MKFLRWLLITFVFVPFSLVINFCGIYAFVYFFGYLTPDVTKIERIVLGPDYDVRLAYGADGGGFFSVLLICLLMCAVVALFSFLIRVIRYGGEHTNPISFFGDFLFSSIRLPLTALASLIAFFGMFTEWEVDSFLEGGDGVFSDFVLYFLMVDIGGGGGMDVSDLFENIGDFWCDFWGEFDELDSRAYKLKAFLYQFAIWLITCLHSVGMFFFIYSILPNISLGENIAWEKVIQFVYPVIAFALAMTTGYMKGIQVAFYTGWMKLKGKTNENGGVDWDTPNPIVCITLGGLVYVLLSPIAILIQTICLLVTIFAPKGCCTLPWDSDLHEEPNFSGEKILYVLTGICT